MEALTFFSRLNGVAQRGGRAVLVGRGPSARFLQIGELGEHDVLIGYNLDRVAGRDVDILFCTHPDEWQQARPPVVRLEDVAATVPNPSPRLQIGSIRFGLGELLAALDVAMQAEAVLTLILVGFDFRAATSDDDILKSARGLDEMQRQIDVNAQHNIFFKIKPSFTRLRVIHAGFDCESDADPRTALTTSHRSKGGDDIEIVAEITTNHFGDGDRLTRLLRAAAAAGVDSVKLQARDVDSFYSAAELDKPHASPFGTTFGEYRRALEISDDTIRNALRLCEELKLQLFFSALDLPSFERLRGLGIHRIKLPSTISEHRSFLAHVAALELEELVISTGMTDSAYEDFILSNFKNVQRLYLLHCVSSYPTAPPDANIAVVRHYWELSKKHPHIVPGYSSHDIGSLGCALAVAAGARMIEKHIKIGSTSWAHFDDTALDVQHEFPEFVRTIRATARMCGSESKKVMASEHHKYRPA